MIKTSKVPIALAGTVALKGPASPKVEVSLPMFFDAMLYTTPFSRALRYPVALVPVPALLKELAMFSSMILCWKDDALIVAWRIGTSTQVLNGPV